MRSYESPGVYPKSGPLSARAASLPQLRLQSATLKRPRQAPQAGPTPATVRANMAFENPIPKCERCWHYRDDVGVAAEHPALCGRCVSNLYGAGEVRAVA